MKKTNTLETRLQAVQIKIHFALRNLEKCNDDYNEILKTEKERKPE
jgi:hypothetical protein